MIARQTTGMDWHGASSGKARFFLEEVESETSLSRPKRAFNGWGSTIFLFLCLLCSEETFFIFLPLLN
ncbi:hypothetical protein VTL71DRAFT_11130 [Oculimacula yallundae]|uniref:Uncharacterized protein n=1 Tax=Oculimacula yallundae TaxID=86028 RepID=A0ABR4CXM1_9HELO